MRKQYSSDEKQTIRMRTRQAIRQLLHFKLSYDLTVHEIEALKSNWRQVEIELHHRYPISVSGVIATIGADGIEGISEQGQFLITDEPIAPEEIVDRLGSFPLEAAACSFVFTLLEVCGDDLLPITNPGFVEQRRSWHRDVYGGSKIGGPKKAKAARTAFGAPFGIDQSDISDRMVESLMRIKKARNEFAHTGRNEMPFEKFFEIVVALICYIALLLIPEERILIEHISDDFEGRFGDAEAIRQGLLQADKF